MIATLTGRVLSKGFDRAVVDVVGVGYEVILSTDSVVRMPEKGEDVFFYIHTNVREDAITLFGFLEEQEKELFLILKTVSGIGPKLALAMLSGLRVGEICQAISAGDIKRLTTLPGVGKKTAERICVDLKEKVAHLVTGTVSPQGDNAGVVSAAGSAASDAISALMNLGYPDSVARGALGKVKKQLGENDFNTQKVEVLIREALRALA
ncbi:MAG: Holliday junction branch migration protein RuvA [Desulforhopalus sp.]